MAKPKIIYWEVYSPYSSWRARLEFEDGKHLMLVEGLSLAVLTKRHCLASARLTAAGYGYSDLIEQQEPLAYDPTYYGVPG